MNKVEELGMNMFSDEMAVNVDVFGSFIASGIVCHLNCRLTVTKHHNAGSCNLKRSKKLSDP
jgi:hypothetical protein